MANNIRSYRKRAGLTLEELAGRIGMTDGNLSKLERGQIGYTQAALESIARELRCKVAELVSDEPPLSRLEETLLSIARALSPDEQDRLVRIAAVFLPHGQGQPCDDVGYTVIVRPDPRGLNEEPQPFRHPKSDRRR
jgi:transcriptional regulator with XRE-family HTH domain